MKLGFSLLVFCAAAFAQAGEVQGLGPPKPVAPAEKPADAVAGRGAAQSPAAGRGAAAGRGGRGAAAAPTAVPVSPKDLKFPPLRAVQIPNITSVTLPNGLKIALLEDHELPIINGVALVRSGSLLDPPEKIGLASMTGTLLRTGGTAVKTSDQMDNVLETMAATIDSSADESYIRVGFGTVKENVETVLGIFHEVLTQPEFRQDKIDATRAQMRAAIAQRNDNPSVVSQREFSSLIFGKDNPLGWLRQYATLDRITRSDLRAFHKRYFFPANVTVGVWGDFDPVQMKVMIEKLFGGWNAPAQPAPVVPQVKETPAPGVYLAEKKEISDTFFTIGYLGVRMNNKDVAPLQLLASILGSGSKGRLPEKARAKTGAPHDIRVAWTGNFEHPGVFAITGSTRSIGTVDVIKLIQTELELVRTTEVTEEELHTARESLLNAMVFAYDTKAKLLNQQLLLEYFGYPKDFLQHHQQAMQVVTRADILRVAKEYIVPKNLTIVLVANPQMIAEPLEKLGGPVNRIDLTIPEAAPQTVETTEASLAEGKQLLQKAQAAAGGAEKMAAIKDTTMVAAYQIDGSVPNIGGTRVTETDRWIAPTIFRQDSTLPAGRISAYTDGRIGWISTPQGWGALAGPQQKQVMGDLFRSWFRLLLSDRIDGRTVNAVDSTSVQITDTTGTEVKVEFDPETGLPRRVTYDTPQAIGAPLYTEDIYEDYHEVDGIKMPFKITINQSGRKFAETTVGEYRLNSGLKPMDLSRRP